MGTPFSRQVYIEGPRCGVSEKRSVHLLNNIFWQAKLATWFSKENKRLETGPVEAARLRGERREALGLSPLAAGPARLWLRLGSWGRLLGASRECGGVYMAWVSGHPP
ncbi:hypothetical protein SKAU_G00355810 [Synaphobranchus kaupii]|uniref:Uncharacterized protein n=1 Tax=Synaphobranchus kaupii TaxID=118154 RepID=A0A9Q1EHB8_SYNKA|nr:hypothetical protein SKAU_G00355810 [Synaphobranchus kaupii]